MVDEGGRGASSVAWARWRWPSRRGWLLISLLVLLVSVRLALPAILARVLVSQGNDYLDGTVEVGDVDLWLLSGGIAVKDVALHPSGAASAEETLVAWKRVYVDIGWWALLRRVARIEDFELEGLRVNVARLRDGRLVLPELRPRSQAGEPESATTDGAEEDGGAEPFGVRIDRAALVDASIRVRDDVPDSPAYRELELPALEVRDLALTAAESTAPGHVEIRAGLRGGVIRVDSSVRPVGAGFEIDTRIAIEDLPLDELHVHEPILGWSRSQGRLGGSVRLTVDPEARVHVSGELSLSDLRIEVAGEDEPALAWRRLAVEIDDVDVARGRVALHLVSLDGLRVLVRPLEVPALPVIPRGDDRPDAVPAPAPSPPPLPASSPPASPDGPAEAPAGEWTVAVGKLSVTGAEADVALAEGPLRVRVGRLDLSAVDAGAGAWKVGPLEIADASVETELEGGAVRLDVATLSASGLESTPGSSASLAATFAEQDARGELAADVVLDPLAARARLDLEDVSLGRYAALSGASPVDLPSGLLQAALTLDYAPERGRLAGQIRVDDLQVATPDGKKAFGIGWESLDVDLRAVEVSFGADDRTPPSVDLVEVALVRPWVRLTQGADGLVLPGAATADAGTPVNDTPGAAPTDADADAATSDETPADAGTPTNDETPADAGTPTNDETPTDAGAGADDSQGRLLRIRADRLRIEDGTVRVTDRSVKPVYRGKVEHLTLDAKAVEIPGNTVGALSIRLDAPGGAPISIDARDEDGAIHADLAVDRIPLAQFNPYLQSATGYTVLAGTASAETSASWGDGRYRADTDLALRDLDVGGATGGTLFEDQFGISLAAALALMRDVTGKIALSIPVEGSREDAAAVALGPVVADALARAILGAITSPLKLLGAVTMVGGKVADIEPSPIAFRPGSTDVTGEAAEHVETLGSVLAAAPQVRLELSGRTSAADVRALQEAAVLADLQSEGGLIGGLRNLASGGTRGAVRKALEARARGEAGALEPDDAATLDELVAEKSVSDDDLTRLADARATSLRDVLVEEDGVPEEQLSIGEPRVTRDDGAAEVAISLLAR